MEPTTLYHKLPKDTRRIRLLTILPNADQSTLVQCILFEKDLDDQDTIYDALSYCWGNLEVTTPVIVNGRKMQVTINLRDALHKLRSYSAPNAMILWADALCINQKDKEETGHQVQFMVDIYSKASTVHAWLDPGGHLEKRGLAALERLSRSDCSEPNRTSVAHAVAYSASDEDLFELAFVSRICDAPYWQRVWIIQELSLARNAVLHQGPHQAMITCWACQWNRINSLFLHLVRPCRLLDPTAFDRDSERIELASCPSTANGFLNIIGALDLNLAAKGLMQRTDARTTMETLTLVMKKKATNDRDYIYSQLFLLRAYMDVDVDYSKTVGEVFEDAVIQLIQNTESLDILEFASSGSCDLASWVPDFRLDTRPHHPGSLRGGTLLSSGRLKGVVAHGRSIPVRARQGVLRLMGVHFDTVTKVKHLSHLEWRHRRRQCLKAFIEFGEDKQVSSSLMTARDPLSNHEVGHLFEFAVARFAFTTSKGYYGLSSRLPSIGDHICVFATPSTLMTFCLRDANSKIQLAYSLVGACTIWRNENPDTSIDPVQAVEEVETGSGRALDELFTPFLLV